MSSYRDTQKDAAAWTDLEGFGEDDEIDDDAFRYATRDHVLFCIDASRSMQRPVATGTKEVAKSPLHMALEVALRIQRAKVMSGPNDSIGILLWNVDPKKEPLELPSRKDGQPSTVLENFRPGTYLFQPLRQISAEEIKRIKAFLEEAQDEIDSGEAAGDQPNVISQQFPPCKPEQELDIADVFECCNHVFRDAGTTLNGQKRVFLITDNERPERGPAFIDGRDTRNPARTRFLDLTSLGVQIDPFFIGREGSFDEDAYWNDILYRSPPEQDDEDSDVRAVATSTSADGLGKLHELMEEQVVRTSSKRVLFAVPMRIASVHSEIVISVNGYSIVAETKKPSYRYYDMSGRAAEEVHTKTTYVAASTGESINKDQIGFAYSFGKGDAKPELLENYWSEEMETTAKEEGLDGVVKMETKPAIKTRIAFTDAEIREFKTMGMKPQIKILGFHDPKNLLFQHNVKHSVFIYPNEKVYAGSTRSFAALLASCAKRNRYGLALCVFRANSTPIFCCMIPQVETLLPNGHQDQAPGFHLIPLPYTDDIRARPEKVDPEATQHCTEEQRDRMLEVVSKLRMKSKSYEPSIYPNPTLAYFYAKLQSLAFEEEFFDPLQSEDKTKPLSIGMHKVAGPLMAQFKAAVQDDVRAHYSEKPAKAAAKKRTAPVEEVDDAFVKGYWKSGALGKLTVAQLKSFMIKNNIPVEGRKADHIAAVESYFAEGDGSHKKTKK